jgi:hypothetical protein
MMKMTRDEALAQLRECAKPGDAEISHILADEILLALIGDQEITEAFEAIKKWYA